MNKLLLLSLFISISFTLSAQKPKEVRELNLKAKTTWITLKKGKRESSYKASEYRYDKSGELIEEIIYNPKGDIIKHQAYQYEKKTKIREIHFDKEGKIIERIEYIYNKNVLSEIQYYNSDSIMVKKEQFIYEQQD